MIETDIKKCQVRTLERDDKGKDIGGICHLTGLSKECNIYDAHNCEDFKAWKIRSDEIKSRPAHVASNWEKDLLFFTNREEYFARFGNNPPSICKVCERKHPIHHACTPATDEGVE